MNEKFVAEIRQPNNKTYGTGYLIRHNLILTCLHTVILEADSDLSEDTDINCWVRLIGDYQEGREDWVKERWSLCWRSPEKDLALIQLRDGVPEFLGSVVNKNLFPNIQFDALKNDVWSIEAIGFPKYKQINSCRNPFRLNAKVSELSGLKEKALREITEANDHPENYEDWKGMSGAAVFHNDHLIGVIAQTNKGNSNNNLWMQPISCVTRDAEFLKIIGANTQNFFVPHASNCAEVLNGFLLELNYFKEEGKFKDAVSILDVPGIFTAEIDDLVAQDWMVNRLIKKVNIPDRKCIKVSRLWKGNNNAIWQGFVDDKDVLFDREDILRKICERSQNKTILITLCGVELLRTEDLNLIIKDFWLPLEQMAVNANKKIVFLLVGKSNWFRDRKSCFMSEKISTKFSMKWGELSAASLKHWFEQENVRGFCENRSGKSFQEFCQLFNFDPANNEDHQKKIGIAYDVIDTICSHVLQTDNGIAQLEGFWKLSS